MMPGRPGALLQLAVHRREPRLVAWLSARLAGADVEALALGFSLLPLWIGIKLYLYLGARQAAAEAARQLPARLLPLLCAADVLTCLAASLVYAPLRAAAARWPRRPVTMAIAAAQLLLHAVLVLLAAANLRVVQLYAQALNFELLQMAPDLRIMRDSVIASADRSTAVVIAAGALLYTARGAAGKAFASLGWRASAWALMAAVGLGGAMTSRRTLEGIYAFGLKTNPVVELARSYRRPSKITAYAERRAALREKLGPGDPLAPLRAQTGVDAGLPALAGKARGKNLLLVVLESTQASALDGRTAPNLTALRASALRLPNHLTTASNTFDAQYSLFYSEPIRGTVFEPRALYAGPPADTSLAEAFAAAGYRTGYFGAGFLRFHDDAWYVRDKGFGTVVAAEDLQDRNGLVSSWGVGEDVVAAAIAKWIPQGRGPFFAVYNPVSPHHPYFAPGPFRRSRGDDIASHYRSAIFYTDTAIGALVERLRALGLLDDTVIVAVSDHGETLSAAGGGHGLAFSADELRVPCFIHSGALFAGGAELEVATNHLDLAPSLAALFDVPAAASWSGRNVFAARVERRRLFTGVSASNFVGVFDGEQAVRYDLSSGEARLHRVTPAGFVDAGDARGTAATELAKSYDERVQLRHLERALGR